MMSSIFLGVIRWLLGLHAAVGSSLWRLYARMRRASVHPTVRFRGRPIVRCHRQARLLLEAGVRVNSSLASNPVIGRRRTALCAIAPGARLELQEGVGVSGVTISAAKEVVIGEGTILGADVMITDTDFHLPGDRWSWRNCPAEVARPVKVGRGCFIGARAIVLKGVTIGDGAVVAAGAVVSRDVPAGCLAVGNPATIRDLDARWSRDPEGGNQHEVE